MLRGVLQWFEPVEDQQAMVLDEQPGQHTSPFNSLGDQFAAIAEVTEGLFEEQLRRYIVALVVPLAVEGMHEYPPRAAPAGIPHPPQPLDDDPGLARSAFGI